MTDLNTQMSGESLDITEQRKQELKQLFPGVFTEVKNDKGEIVEAIDFERLKAELGSFSELYEGRRERYGMDWPGKRDCLRLIQEPSRATLKPCREESVDFDNTENLFIEGDNLEVLKLLQKAYYGKIKMIYIDPPYNTGNEFIYPDNFSESLETYLSYAGLSDDEGKKFSTNNANEGRFHTKWLNMMFPRLYLARNLLREDGVIFISIDDNELENLRRICDEIFGEENFIACLVWEKGRKNDARRISVGHEYILAYARSLSFIEEIIQPWREPKEGIKEIVEEYERLKSLHADNYDEISRGLISFYGQLPKDHPSKKHARSRFVDQRGIYRDNNISWPGGGGPRYDIIHPVTLKPCKVPADGWRFIESTMREKISSGYVIFRDDESQSPILKSYIYTEPLDSNASSDSSGDKLQVMGSVFYKHSQPASDVQKELFGEKIFENPKDHEVLARIISYCCDNDGIVLDFFSGSGSTAHATIFANFKSQKKLKFILVQIPEIIDENSPARKYKLNTISDLGKERIRRSSRKIRQEISGQLDLEGKASIDLGFKVLKLDRSNFKQWQISNIELMDDELKKQLELHIDQVDPNATQEDILYELLIKAGVMPTKKIELIELAGHAVFSVDEGGWLICLQNKVEQSLIDAVLDKEPVQFICLDRAFHGNDQLKANAVSAFANFNEGRDKADQIEFRTV